MCAHVFALVCVFAISSDLERLWRQKSILRYTLRVLWCVGPSPPILAPTTAHFNCSVCCTQCAIKPHWWHCGVSGEELSTKLCVCSYSSPSYVWWTSHALVKFALYLNHVSLLSPYRSCYACAWRWKCWTVSSCCYLQKKERTTCIIIINRVARFIIRLRKVFILHEALGPFKLILAAVASIDPT